jgi:hypothetical protein
MPADEMLCENQLGEPRMWNVPVSVPAPARVTLMVAAEPSVLSAVLNQLVGMVVA